MCNFNKQNEDTKVFIHLLMTKSAQSVGGANFFIGLSEALRATKPHPLTTNKCHINSDNIVMKWNKIIFKDKLEALEQIFLNHKSSESQDFNILEADSDKKKKRILNVVRALAPVEFVVTPKNPDEGEGFSFTVFETIEDDYVKINSLFMALFFCSVEYTKKALKYTI